MIHLFLIPLKIQKVFFHQQIEKYKASELDSNQDDFNQIADKRKQVLSDLFHLFRTYPSIFVLIKTDVKLVCFEIENGLKHSDGKLLHRFLFILLKNLENLSIFQSIPIPHQDYMIKLEMETSQFHRTYVIKKDQFTANNNIEAVSKFFFIEMKKFEENDLIVNNFVTTFSSIISLSILLIRTEDFKKS